MPIVDVLRIVIEKIDKYTHLPVTGDEAEKYVIDCNTSADLNPVYVGGTEYVYEADNSLVNYNVENFTMYGVNLTIQTASFNLKRHAFLTGGVFIDQDKTDVTRHNLFATNRLINRVVAYDNYDDMNSPIISLAPLYNDRQYSIGDDGSVITGNYVQLISDLSNFTTINNYRYAYNPSTPTRESWIDDNIANKRLLGYFVSSASVVNIRDQVNGINEPDAVDAIRPGTLNSYKDILASWKRAKMDEELDGVSFAWRSTISRTLTSFYNEKQYRIANDIEYSGYWLLQAYARTASYNGNGVALAAQNTKYNFLVNIPFATVATRGAYQSSGSVDVSDYITPEQTVQYFQNNIRILITLNPNAQEHYKIYSTQDKPSINKNEFQVALDNDEYLLEFINPNDHERIFNFGPITATQASVETFQAVNRLEYTYTYTKSDKIKLSVFYLFDFDELDNSDFFSLDISRVPPTHIQGGKLTVSTLIWTMPVFLALPVCEIAGQQNVSNRTINYDWFNDAAEYEEELVQTGTELPDVNYNTYYSPHSISPNETNLFNTTLYTRDYLGADITKYYKFYMNNCFSDKQPGISISEMFNDNEMHIYARDSFVTIRPALEVMPLTPEEYQEEIEGDE